MECAKCEKCESCRKRKRTDEEYKKLINRLNRIEGQVRGIKSMLESDAYCADILIQTEAVNSAVNSFQKELLRQHITTCVADDLKNGGTEKAEELVNIVQKLMK